MNSKRSVSIILPNFNGEKLLSRCLDALILSLEYSSLISRYEIIVVDDCSTDTSVEVLENNYSQVKIVKSVENVGFSKTCNKGIRISDNELVLLLNTDMILSLDFFDKLIPFFYKDDTFSAFSKIISKNGDVQEAQKKIVKSIDKIHYQENLAADGEMLSLYSCGGNVLIDKRKLLELEGLDEMYSPFYFEDFDMSLRAWCRGWKTYYTSETNCVHEHSATINNAFSKEKVQSIFIRNKMIFNYRFLPLFGKCILLMKILFHSAQEIVGRKNLKPYCNAMGMILRGKIKTYPLNISSLCNRIK